MRGEPPNERAQGTGPDLKGFARAVQLLIFAFFPGTVRTRAERAEVITDLREHPRYAAVLPRLFEVEEMSGVFAGDGWPGLVPTIERPRLNSREEAELRDLCATHAWPEALAAFAADGVVDRAVLLEACSGALQRDWHFFDMRGFLRVHAAVAPGADDVAARTSHYAELLSGSRHSTFDALAALAADGEVDRAALLDACLGALQRGGGPTHMRNILHVHDAMAPGLDELAARTGDYAALLPGSHSTVAATAQSELRRLDEAGRLELDTLLAVSRAVLSRSEKKLVRSQLAWLDRAARRGHGGQVARVVATAFTQEAADLQQRALTLAIKHATADAHSELADAASALPADLRARACEAFGSTAAAEPAASAPPAWEPPPPPDAIASPGELAEELAALFAGSSFAVDPVALERVLAALVAFAAEDRTAVHAALAPVVKRYGISPGLDQEPQDRWPRGFNMVAPIAGAAIVPARMPEGVEQRWKPARRQFTPGRIGTGPQPVLGLRLFEIALGLDHAPRPLLMAAPTTATGLIDPAELLARVARAAREDWEPWPYDFELALLRLPREADSGIAAGARRLGTAAGGRLAEWIETGGLPTPESRREQQAFSEMFTEHRRTRMVLTASPHATSIAADLTNLPAPRRWNAYGSIWLPCWPAMLPAHREIAAAHLLPEIAPLSATGRGLGHLLPLLAEADGPAGPAMTLVSAYGLAAREQADRVCAVDALLTLAARGGFDWAALGREIGDHGLPLNRIVPALHDLARAGAWRQVWEVIAAALPRALPPAVERAPQRLADLVALGVEVAGVVRPGETIPELRSVTARGGSSRLGTEARRLLAVL
ncbi:hypothetical protein HCC61_26980 [Streptomyces sp. HNM0575]|uniref:DUF6493 family protein n=1 Tax=Streptomyces sp. HNM0575 TaxID=2716338 RepID=UPI00145C4FCE|nr:DUF6493 family protein [Streptomyces sp. HNM0575]NLU76241.1 hypothetical protein [Streptomyces sp. HNM0575]